MFNYSWAADVGTSFLSDHTPITLELLLNRNDRGKGLFRFADALCSNQKFQELLAKDIETFTLVNITRPLERDRASPRVLWDTLKSIIRGRTIKFLARSKRESAQDLKVLQCEIEDLIRIRDGFVEFGEEYSEIVDKLETAEHDFEERFVRRRKKAHMIHSARYQVYGNVSSAYFFRKVKGIPGAVRFLFNDSNDLLDSDEEILEHCRVFYDNLYSTVHSASFKMSNFSYIPPTKRLIAADVQILDEEITVEDLHNALQKMRKGASPGFDGLTVNFYLAFWNLISPFLVASVQQAASLGSFSLDQRRGIIKMLPKCNRAPNRVVNLRPITLLNVDYKLVTKVLALRLKLIIPKIVHTDQTGFVTNRFLGSNVLDVQTLMHILDRLEQQQEVATLALDIEKAFDTVDWGFIRLVLRSYGFPPSFINWVTTMQTNVELRVLNNGHLSDPIVAKKGVAQGCSLSPYLFILMIETLAHHICSNPRINGLIYHDYEKKINLVADDCLLTLQATVDNFAELHTTLSHFSAVSGLRTNFNKSVLLCDRFPDGWLENPAVSIYKHATMSDGFTYLGTRLGNAQVLSSNFQLNTITMKDLLRSRPLQATSLSGRILQIKTLVASKFVYKFMLLPTPHPQFLHKLDTEYHDYIWQGGRHKLNKPALCLPKSKGGFNMLNVSRQELSLKLGWINRFLKDTECLSLTQYFLFTCTRITTFDFFRCNLYRSYHRLHKWPIPQVLGDILEAFFHCKYVSHVPADSDVTAGTRILTSLFCFNEALLNTLPFAQEYALYLFLADNGVYTVQDVLINGLQITGALLIASSELFPIWAQLWKSIPPDWTRVVGDSYNTPDAIPIIHKFINGAMPTSACRLWLFNKNEYCNRRPIECWCETLMYTFDELVAEWKRISGFYRLAYNPLLQDFHLLFVNRAFQLNNVVAKYRPSVSPECTFCHDELETYEHLFYECKLVKALWRKIKRFYQEFVDDSYLILSPFNCLLSLFESRLLSLISIIVKRRIFLCKINNFPLAFSVFIEDIKNAPGIPTGLWLKILHHGFNLTTNFGLPSLVMFHLLNS